jgi:GTP pyrophosphokinase
MYQSLHTTVVTPDGERVEFQIRTNQMHEMAEDGVASHWRYKEKEKGKELNERYVAWLRELVQAQKEEPDAREFLAAVKAEVVPDMIYVFTPNGEIKELPDGSTPVDFAYSIHTEVGHRCVGARVDGRMVPLRHVLESGSTVEIITSQSHSPSRDWLKFVASQKAKARIKHWIKTEERKQSIDLGVKLIEDELRRKSLSPSLMKSDEMEEVAKSYNFQSVEDLFVAVGYGKVSQHKVLHKLVPGEHPPETVVKAPKPLEEHKGITIRGVDDILYHTAKCCFPVPGDSLLGFITRGKGVTVHRSDCQSLDRLATDKARLVEVEWAPQNDAKAYARLIVSTVDKPGIMANLTATISGVDINISRLEVTTTPERTARMIFVLEVKDKPQLQRVMNRLVQTDGVLSVNRN